MSARPWTDARMHRGAAGWAGSLILFCLTTAGCVSFVFPAEAPANRCSEDADCTTPGQCDVEAGLCFSADIEPYDLLLRVRAGEDRIWQGATLNLESFRLAQGQTRLDLKLPAPVTVQGNLRVQEAVPLLDVTQSETAELRFSQRNATPGHPAETFTLTTSIDTQGDEHGFSLPLRASERYALEVSPLSDLRFDLPPYQLTVDTSDAAEQEVGIDSGALQILSGTLVGTDGTGLSGLQVRVVEGEGDRPLSSIGVSDNDGAFSLKMPLTRFEETDWELEVTGDEASGRLATLRAPAALVLQTLESGGPLVVPEEPGVVTYAGRVDATLGTGTPTGLAEVQLRFALDELRETDMPYDLLDWSARLEARPVTDEEGAFAVQLLPGEYDLVITPPRGGAPYNRFATGVDRQRVAPQPDGRTQQGIAFNLEPRAAFEGTLIYACNALMNAEATVQAQALGEAGSVGPRAVHNRDAESLSDSRGLYELPLDTGYYDLLVRVPESSGLAWTVVVNQQVANNATDRRLDLEVNLPALVSGRVLDHTGAPLGEASIDAYAIVESLGGALRPVLIGRAQSDATGGYRLTLPPRIDNELKGRREPTPCPQ